MTSTLLSLGKTAIQKMRVVDEVLIGLFLIYTYLPLFLVPIISLDEMRLIALSAMLTAAKAAQQ